MTASCDDIGMMGDGIVNHDSSFLAASQALGLQIDLEASHLEPRYSLRIERDEHGQRLRIRTRNDESIAVLVVDLDDATSGLLLEVHEETVQREPILDLWLPYSARHQHLVHCPEDAWVVEPLPGMSTVATVAEARSLLERRGENPA
jgi:hypothetical protein